jgi:hypothetical protein
MSNFRIVLSLKKEAETIRRELQIKQLLDTLKENENIYVCDAEYITDPTLLRILQNIKEQPFNNPVYKIQRFDNDYDRDRLYYEISLSAF